MERDKFCPDRYLGDTFGCHDDYLYQCAMAMRPHWATTTQNEAPMNDSAAGNTTLSSSSSSSHYFDQHEQSLLLSIPYPLLPNKVLQPQQQQQQQQQRQQQDDHHPHRRLMLPLVDILFAYVYDHLLTDGEPTVESAWTVSTLSATLAALEDWSDDDDDDITYNDDTGSAENRNMTRPVVESCLRRSLVYPYLRSFDFAIHVTDHVVQILRRGLRTVIRCILHVRRILDRSELYYLGNKIFVDPYLAWLQKCSNVVNFDKWMMQTADEMERIVASSSRESRSDLKESIGLGLVAIENGVVEAGAVTSASFSREDEDADDSSSSSSSDDSTATTSVGDEPEPGAIKEVSTTTAFVSEQIGNLRI
jgi:protein SHQ1